MVSRPVVVDTSVAFKWLIAAGESSVEGAQALIDSQREGDSVLVAPSTLPVELANAVRYTRLLCPEKSLDLIEQLGLLDVELFATTVERVHAAATLSYRHKISVYDALFLQLAEELDCPLVTADRRAFACIDTPVEILLL